MPLIHAPMEEGGFLEQLHDQRIEERPVIDTTRFVSDVGKRITPLRKHLKPASIRIEIAPFHKRAIHPASADHIREIEQSLDDLVTLLGQKVPWVLTGGLAIPVLTGSYYRRHSDIDIGIHRDDVEQLDFEARASGYALFSSKLTLTIPRLKRKLDVYTSLRDTDQGASRQSQYCLKLLEPRRTSPAFPRFIDSIDVFTYHFEQDMLVQDHNGIAVPSSSTTDVHHTTKSGKQIRVHNPAVLAGIKSLGWSDVDALDARVLAEHLSTIDRTEQRQSVGGTK